MSEDVDMAVVSKPINGAFVLKKEKADEFLDKKEHRSADLLKRFGLNDKKEQTPKRGVK